VDLAPTENTLKQLIRSAQQTVQSSGIIGFKIFITVSMFHRAFFNSIVVKHQHMHFFTFNTVFV